MANPTEVFKIRRDDGLFSTGGQRPRFAKRGKSWATRAHVNQHLAQFNSRFMHGMPYQNCELVRYEFVEAGTTPLAEVFDEVLGNRTTKDDLAQQREIKRREAEERSQLALLRRKYPDG